MYVTPGSQGHPGQARINPTRWAADRLHKEGYRSISSDNTKRLLRPRHQGKVFFSDSEETSLRKFVDSFLFA
jgi:hypothetical protein